MNKSGSVKSPKPNEKKADRARVSKTFQEQMYLLKLVSFATLRDCFRSKVEK